MVDYDLGKVVGDKGDTGNGIASIELISTSGKVKTYRITFTDGDHFDYQVSDGADGSSGIADIVTSWSATLHDDKVPSEKLAKNSLDAKLDNAISSTAVTIASNDNILITDYSDSNKVKRVSGILASQVKDSNAHSNIGSNANDTQGSINTSIDTALGNKANSSSLSTVATSGSYTDLTNKPSYTATVTSSTAGAYEIGKINVSGSSQTIYGKDTGGTSVDIVTSWESTPSDSKVASEKLTKDSLDAKLGTSLTSTAVTVASSDNILITDYSDSSKIKRVANILASQVKDANSHTNIGSSANDTQATINTNIDTALSNKANSSSLSTVATTGSYNDLTNKPTIPSISGLEETANKVSSWSTTTTDAHYPSERLVKTSLDAKANSSSLSTVATSGSYTDLSNKPTIPTLNVFYGTCSTGVSTQVKVVTVTGWSFTTGNILFVKFDNANSYNGTAQIKIDSTTKDIATVGTTKTSRYHWSAGEVVGFIFDGTNMVMLDDGLATTTYYGVTKLSSSTSSTSETLSATPKAVKSAYDLASTKLDTSAKVNSWSATVSDDNVASEKLVKDSLDGKLDNAIGSSAVTVASDDNILITDTSDSSKVKKVANILASQVKDSSAHSNIGSSANDTQATINTKLDTELANRLSVQQGSENRNKNVVTDGSGNITFEEKATAESVSQKMDKFYFKQGDLVTPVEWYVDYSYYDYLPTANHGILNFTNRGNYLFIFNYTIGRVEQSRHLLPPNYYLAFTVTSTNTNSEIHIGGIYDGGLVNVLEGSTECNIEIECIDGVATVTNSDTHSTWTTDYGSYVDPIKFIEVVNAGTMSITTVVYQPYTKMELIPTKVIINDDALSNLNTGMGATQSAINSAIDTAISDMLTSSDIVDNLTTNDNTKVLSAKQGKVLYDLIGSAITYIVGGN